MENIDMLIRIKEEELLRYRESSKDFPTELRRRFSTHYINMLETQLNELKLKKDMNNTP
jgi:phospholipid N-methyltransferase